ncbi:MAG: S41 family peptidase [Sphingomonas sp.]|nr:S41 family peptidase [Sphingomonas sp.]
MRIQALVAVLASCAALPLIAQPVAHQPIKVPAAQADAPLKAEEARRTAAELAQILDENYVDPAVAKRYAAKLRDQAAAGAYDRIGAAARFAKLLTQDLQAVSPDNHLQVMLRGAGGPQTVMVKSPGSGGGDAPAAAKAPASIEEARSLAPGIGYIRFNEFTGDPRAVAATAKFMADHADAETIIIDLRTHRGGGLEEMDVMLPYLFGQETALLQMDTRASVDRASGSPIGGEASLRQIEAPEEVVRREHFVRPHATEKRLIDARVYLLTSNFTASAAEHFALALKRTGRATLIGEKTAGAGNYGGIRPIGNRFMAFVPVGMTRDPRTGARWEANGIEPDMPVKAELALVEALKRNGVEPAEAQRLSALVHPKGPMRRPAPLS